MGSWVKNKWFSFALSMSGLVNSFVPSRNLDFEFPKVGVSNPQLKFGDCFFFFLPETFGRLRPMFRSHSLGLSPNPVDNGQVSQVPRLAKVGIGCLGRNKKRTSLGLKSIKANRKEIGSLSTFPLNKPFN